MSDIKIQTTNDIKSDENAEPKMTAETYRFVMSWDNYPEPATGERQVKHDVHTRLPFPESYDGDACLLPVYEQKEPCPGAGFCEGNNYGKKSKPDLGKASPHRAYWQTPFSKAAWNERAKKLHEMEVASIRQTVCPEMPHACIMCRDIDPSKKACKLPAQEMCSLCSRHNKHRGLIVTPATKKQLPYWNSLRHKLDEFEKRNRPAKIWRVSTLSTFNRNDGRFIRYDTNKAGEPIRVYQDSVPRMVINSRKIRHYVLIFVMRSAIWKIS